MLPLYREPGFTFRFAEDRIIPRFYLEGVAQGTEIVIHAIDSATSQRLGMLGTATVGDGGWVELPKPIIVRAGDSFVAICEERGAPT